MSYGPQESKHVPNNKTRAYLPKRPEYELLEKRIETYVGWPVPFLDSERVARSGFWYLGEADRVRCFYCGGGLRNWEPKDDPMMEHKRVFPTCGFLLQLMDSEDEREELAGQEAMPKKSKL